MAQTSLHGGRSINPNRKINNHFRTNKNEQEYIAVYGYHSVGDYACDLENQVGINAALNGLNGDYCRVLALTRLLGTPQYGREGKVAVEELPDDKFDQTGINVKKLESLSGMPCEQRLIDDLKALDEYNGSNDEILSNEAKCVRYTEEALVAYALLSEDERPWIQITVRLNPKFCVNSAPGAK